MSNYYYEKIPEQLWLETAVSYIHPPEKCWKPVSERFFCSFFKLTPESCSDLWYHLEMYWERNMNDSEALTLGQIREIHLLWVLHYVSMRLEYNQMYNHVKPVYNYTVYIYVPSITYIPVANNGYLVLLLHVLS